MSTITSKIKPFLWFDNQAEEAVAFYTSVFPNSKVGKVARYPEGSPGPAGEVMTVEFELDGQQFMALNGGPIFQFTEAISFLISCDTQEEVDHYWEMLLEGGQELECGWLKDKYGLTWQVIPKCFLEMVYDPDKEKVARAMQVMMTMKKMNIAELQRAIAD